MHTTAHICASHPPYADWLLSRGFPALHTLRTVRIHRRTLIFAIGVAAGCQYRRRGIVQAYVHTAARGGAQWCCVRSITTRCGQTTSGSASAGRQYVRPCDARALAGHRLSCRAHGCRTTRSIGEMHAHTTVREPSPATAEDARSSGASTTGTHALVSARNARCTLPYA